MIVNEQAWEINCVKMKNIQGTGTGLKVGPGIDRETVPAGTVVVA